MGRKVTSAAILGILIIQLVPINTYGSDKKPIPWTQTINVNILRTKKLRTDFEQLKKDYQEWKETRNTSVTPTVGRSSSFQYKQGNKYTQDITYESLRSELELLRTDFDKLKGKNSSPKGNFASVKQNLSQNLKNLFAKFN